MENLKKRWAVTYTKHIKQKRKVYQDGFLDLHVPTNKVMLFDDCEKLLECRILKGEEIVSSGETLTFSGYLVDVGDPDGEVDQKPIPDLNLYGKEREILSRPRPSLTQRHKFTSPSIASEDEKDTPKKGKARLNNLSPSQKIIREFKKSELQKYGALRSYPESPDTVNPHVTEWQVMYTTQVTQKAKKYHDGFLRLAKSGSLGRQIMLFDESRKLLDSRFLKKDEIIRSHESVAFDAHLVNIGEPERENQLPMDLNFQGNNVNLVGKESVMHENQSCVEVHRSLAKEFKKSELQKYGALQSYPESPDTVNPQVMEWQVMYTTQVTQKAKKYHDGFLRLTKNGSFGRQIMLYDASRKLLDSRFLKEDEIIRSHESLAFDAHLVDIGEPERENQLPMDLNVQRNNLNLVHKEMVMHENQNCLQFDKSLAKGKYQTEACSREDADSRSIFAVERTKISNTTSTDKSLRDIRQILSILQKPIPQKSANVGCTGNSMTTTVFSAKGIHISDADVDYPKHCQILGISLPNAELSKNKDTGESRKLTDNEKYSNLMPSEEISIPSGDQLSTDHVTRNSDQPHLDNTKADTKRSDGAFASHFGHASYVPTDDKKKSNVQLKSTREIDEWPTFDLGF